MKKEKESHKVMLHKDNTLEFSWVPEKDEGWGATYNISPTPFDGMTVYTNYGTVRITEFEVWYELGKEGK
jgi:hypothetical protein